MKIKNKKILLLSYTQDYKTQSPSYTLNNFPLPPYITIFIRVIRAIHNPNSIN